MIDLVYMSIVIQFPILRYVIISCVYISNDILFVFMIVVATTDHNNAEILRLIVHLREIGSAWRGGDELRRSLSDSLLSIVDTIARSNDALYSITSYRDRKRQQYAHGLSYNEVKKLKITKQHIYSLFRLPGTDNFRRSTCHIFLLSGAPFHPSETIGWIGGTWFLTFPLTTLRKYHCTSSENCMQSL